MLQRFKAEVALRATWASSQRWLSAGLPGDDIDVFEYNEAFASVVLASSRELDVPLER